jgi:hypothetical protein
MKDYVTVDPIPFDVAAQLCANIRAEAEAHWQTAAARWCYQCQQEAGGDPAKRGILRAPGNRGCYLVNERYLLWKQTKKH